MYFYVKNDATPSDIEVPVYAPGNIVVTSIGLRNYAVLNGKTNYTDYTLTFKVCDELEGYFHHVRSLTHPDLEFALQAQACVPQGPGSEKFCNFPTNIALAAGVPMATTGDRLAGVGGLDLGMRDYRLQTGRSAFANPDRWCQATGGNNVFSQCYTVCPLDYLPASASTPYLDLFYDGLRVTHRTDEPRCGDFYTDRAGTAQGRWFSATNQAPFTEAPHVFLGPGAFSASVYEFSMGTSVPNLQARGYHFATLGTGLINRRFSDIADGQVYCYETFYNWGGDALAGRNPITSFTLLVQLASDGRRLLIEKRLAASCGVGPWSMGPNTAAFER